MPVKYQIIIATILDQGIWEYTKDTAEKTEWKPLDIYLDDYSQLLKAPKITKRLLNEIKMRQQKKTRGRRHQLKDNHLFVQAGNSVHQVDFLEILNYKKFHVRIHWKPFSKPPMAHVVPEKKVAELQKVIAQKDVRIGDLEKELAETQSSSSKKTGLLLKALRDVNDLGGQLKQQKKETTELSDQLHQVKEENKGLILRAEKAEKRVEELTRQLEEQTRSNKEVQDKFDAANQESSRLEFELAQANAKLEELGRSKNGAVDEKEKTDVAHLKSQLDQKTFEMAELLRQKEEMEALFEETHQKFISSRNLAESLQREVYSLREPEDHMFPGLTGF